MQAGVNTNTHTSEGRTMSPLRMCVLMNDFSVFYKTTFLTVMDYYYFTYITGTNANTDNSSGLKKKMGRMRMEMSCCPTTWTE